MERRLATPNLKGLTLFGSNGLQDIIDMAILKLVVEFVHFRRHLRIRSLTRVRLNA